MAKAPKAISDNHRGWGLHYVTSGIEIVGPPRRELLEEMVKHLDERYQPLGTDASFELV